MSLLQPVLAVFLVAETLGAAPVVPSDPQATAETRALFRNLHALAARGTAFGHQDSLAYGIGWTGRPEGFDSDVQRVCGHFPAVFGWDLGHVGEDRNIDGVPFTHMKRWIRAVYERGGINTISWHARVPGTGQSAWTRERVVERILPGGDRHAAFTAQLDQVAAFLGDLRGAHGEAIPVVLRPWHEHSGSWFWWGAGHCSPEQFRHLWRFTLDYLRQTRGLHNLLTAISPAILPTRAAYLERYPGDDLVDVLGMDLYPQVADRARHGQARAMIDRVVRLARERGKIAALTETGYEAIPDPRWWTGSLLPVLQADAPARSLAWVLVWRNGRKTHHYAPYPGHPSVPDFRVFAADPLTVFLEDLPPLYGHGDRP